jgi:DNA-binding XRE family transcriptional regulator
MWIVGVDWYGQRDLFSPRPVLTEVTLEVHPGLWARKFLNRAGKNAGTALQHFGYLAKETLQVNPYREALAARLMVYLTLLSHLRTRFCVGTILEQIIPTPDFVRARRDRRRRYDLKQEWDRALFTCHNNRWKIDFDPATYSLEIRPDWALPPADDADETPPPPQKLPRDYFDTLLNAKVALIPPFPIPQPFATRKESHRRGGRKPMQASLTGTQVREARVARGWSQRQLADAIGKSQQWVAAIELGTRRIQLEDANMLRTVLMIDGDKL